MAEEHSKTDSKWLEAAELLEAIVEDRGLLAPIDEATRQRLLIAAGRVSHPDRYERRRLARARRKLDRDEVRKADDEILQSTGIRALRREPVFVTPPLLESGTSPAPAAGAPEAEVEAELKKARNCYVCKADFHKVHAFYDHLCAGCAELNWRKRHQTADLTGRVALITGARVKIGYHAAIKLLRAGCRVVVTTRFPRDAARRYATEADFETYCDRLEIHGLDLRHTPSVEALCLDLVQRLPRLDFIINNACQTVRRPPGFYQHLMDGEETAVSTLPEAVQHLLSHHEELRRDRRDALARRRVGLLEGETGRTNSAALSQVPLLDEDLGESLELFPTGRLDQDLQQIDLRTQNSWRLTLSQVPAIELLEVQLVNAVAPFVLNARLKPLMLRVPTEDKHVVNVSAMEGQFYRRWKTDRHPHTNMAKAALNMMTRTSAADYIKDGIHMNSVDTGWITDEDPVDIAARKVEEHGFHPPLDVVDGAARILDPIFDGFLTGEHGWGQFLKDYKATPW